MGDVFSDDVSDELSWEERMRDTLDRAGVPRDEKWRTLILYMRSLQHYDSLTQQQKQSLQNLVMGVLKEKDFSDDRFLRLQGEKETIIIDPCTQKLNATIKDLNTLMGEFQDLLKKRKGDVKSLQEKTITTVESGADPSSMVGELRSAFQEVITTMEADAAKLTRQSFTDALTGLNNRRALDEHLQSEIERWMRERFPLCVIMIDIDYFKKFNDTYGHRIGDQALKNLARILMRSGKELEKTEAMFFPARYGGEEFAVVLSHMSGKHALEFADFLRQRVEQFKLQVKDMKGNVIHKGIRMTISLGVAEMDPTWEGVLAENLVEAADRALYQAKAGGRNQVMRYEAEGGEGMAAV